MTREAILMPQNIVEPAKIVPEDIPSRYEVRPVKEDPDIMEVLHEGAALYRADKSVFVRKAIRAATERLREGQPLDGVITKVVENDGFRTFTAPYLNAVPCGPWETAFDSGESFTVTDEVADELEARDGDRWIRANGQSMEGAGIMDGFLVLVRPYENKSPRRGEIVLVQTFHEDAECRGTLKRFNGFESDGRTPKLLDGHDEDYALPKSFENVVVVGRAVGVVGRV